MEGKRWVFLGEQADPFRLELDTSAYMPYEVMSEPRSVCLYVPTLSSPARNSLDGKSGLLL